MLSLVPRWVDSVSWSKAQIECWYTRDLLKGIPKRRRIMREKNSRRALGSGPGQSFCGQWEAFWCKNTIGSLDDGEWIDFYQGLEETRCQVKGMLIELKKWTGNVRTGSSHINAHQGASPAVMCVICIRICKGFCFTCPQSEFVLVAFSPLLC